MQRWLRTTLVIVWRAFAVFAILIVLFIWLMVKRTYRPVGGHWYSARYADVIADSGLKPVFLLRGRVPFFRRDVAKDITHIQYLGDDCVAYTYVNGRNDELYAACGDHTPVLLDHIEDYSNYSLNTDPLRLGDKTITVVEVKRRASQE